MKAHSLSWQDPSWILGRIPQDPHDCPVSGFGRKGSATTSTGDRYLPVSPLAVTPGHGGVTQPRAARTGQQLGHRTEGAEALPDS